MFVLPHDQKSQQPEDVTRSAYGRESSDLHVEELISWDTSRRESEPKSHEGKEEPDSIGQEDCQYGQPEFRILSCDQ